MPIDEIMLNSYYEQLNMPHGDASIFAFIAGHSFSHDVMPFLNNCKTSSMTRTTALLF